VLLQAAGDADHPAALLVNAEGVTSPEDLMLLSEPDIDGSLLTNSSGNTVRMPAATKRKILRLQEYYNSWPIATRALSEWMNRDEADFLAFIANPPVPPPTAAIAASTTPLADEFGKGTRRSVSDYKPFKDKKLWNQWHRQLLTTGSDHGIDLIFSATYVPANADEVALFRKVKKFAMSVFSATLLESQASSILR
jgi:hypothetical protein